MFLGHFWAFFKLCWSFLLNRKFFLKHPAAMQNLAGTPNLKPNIEKNADSKKTFKQTERWTERQRIHRTLPAMAMGSEMILMFIKLVFLATLSFERPLATQNVKSISLNNEQCLARLMITYLNLDERS